MNVLNLNDWGVKRTRANNACLADKKVMARGSFAAVFDNGDTVLKLTLDSKTADFFSSWVIDRGIHYPVTTLHGEVGETSSGAPLYLLEMEKLDKLGGHLTAARQARTVIKMFGDLTPYQFYERVRKVEEGEIDCDLPASLVADLSTLAWYVSNHIGVVGADLQRSNMLARHDGTLVLVDPVFDRDVYSKAARHLLRIA